MNHYKEKDPGIFRIIDLTFTSYYVLEVGLGMLGLRSQFFFGFDCGWNWFDMVIVSLSLFEEFLAAMSINAIDTSFLRVLRFLRISKLLRMFEAMRMFKDIKIMVDALQGSFAVFVMCALMLMMYLSIFAIFFVQGWTARLSEDPSIHGGVLHKTVHQDFGDVPTAMVSLFMALSGGQDWIAFYTTIRELGPLYTVLYFFFFLFALMSFFNVITGVFCEKAMSLARPGPHEQMIRRRQKEMRDAKEMIALLKKVVGLSGPTISDEDFDALMEDEEIVTYFEVRGLSTTSARRFFTVLKQLTKEETLDFATFVSACVKLDGPASSIDLHVMDMETRAIQEAMKQLQHDLMDHIKIVDAKVDAGQYVGTSVAADAPWMETLAPRPPQPTYHDSAQPRGVVQQNLPEVLSVAATQDPFAPRRDARLSNSPLFPSQDQNVMMFASPVGESPVPSLHPAIHPDDEMRPQTILPHSPVFGGGANRQYPAIPEGAARGNVHTFHYV
jgi:hypothetical protein